MAPSWDTRSLEAWLLEQGPRDILEDELLHEWYPSSSDAGCPVNLELFEKHFVLMRRLWLLDDELRASSGRRLWIRSIRITLLEPPSPGTCGWLDPETGQYCRQATSGSGCPRHNGTIPALRGTRDYYLNLDNLKTMTEDRLKTLMDQFWTGWAHWNDAGPILEEWGLTQTSGAREIRRRWRELSLMHHPDQGGDASTFRRLSLQWEILKTWPGGG